MGLHGSGLLCDAVFRCEGDRVSDCVSGDNVAPQHDLRPGRERDILTSNKVLGGGSSSRCGKSLHSNDASNDLRGRDHHVHHFADGISAPGRQNLNADYGASVAIHRANDQSSCCSHLACGEHPTCGHIARPIDSYCLAAGPIPGST